MRWESHRARVERAMHRVRREDFVPANLRAHAGDNTPLPIGWAQTISQPSLVGFMTTQLELSATDRVLEIGTGSGYQTAILAELAGEVFTIERLSELGAPAQARLHDLGYRNIQFRHGDGALGWPEQAPFDAVIVTAAPETLPRALVDQLQGGGRLVAPLGSCDRDDQVLVRVDKGPAGSIVQRELGRVRFVPLVSDLGSRS